MILNTIYANKALIHWVRSNDWLWIYKDTNLIFLALSIQNEILRLISTGVILIWLVLQMQTLQQKTFQFLFNIEQIKVNWFFSDLLILHSNLSLCR
jgi:hypothetical protein